MSTDKLTETVANTDVPVKKSRKKLFIGAGVLAAIALGGFIYFMNSANYETTDNAQLDADIVSIKSSVPGYIKQIYFKDNQHVKRGDTLIVIDDTDLKTRVAQSQAALENSKANLLAAQSNSSASNQNITAFGFTTSSVGQNINSTKARLTNAKTNFQRISNMLKEGAATQAQYDAAKTELDVTQAQYDSAVEQFNASTAQSKGVRSQAEAQRAQITLAEAMVKQREAELQLAQTQLNNSVILSPCEGIVTRRAVEVGQYITVAQPLCSTIDNQHLWVTANFKETQIEHLKPGQEVDIKLDAYPDAKLHGVVQSYIGATGAKFSLLPPDNSTGNFVKIIQRIPIRIDLTEYPKENADFLFPGLSAFVKVKVK